MSGQLDCRLKRHFAAKYCVFRDSGTSMLVNAKDPELLQVLCRGDAFLSRLDGEWGILP